MMNFLVIAFLSLFSPGLAAPPCNATALRVEIVENCKGASNDQPCPAPCVASLAIRCPQPSEELTSTWNDFAFCKPSATTGKGKAGKAGKSLCSLKRTKQACVGSCQWCGRECKAAKGKCPQPCVDDLDGMLATSGYTCPVLLQIISQNCQFDLGELSTELKGVTPAKLCPVSCSLCPSHSGRATNSASSSSSSSSSASSPSSTTSSSCKDDPTGELSSRGFDCGMLLQVASGNCDFDLTALSPDIPKGTTPSQLCPASCKRCDGQRSVQAPTEKTGKACQDDPTGIVAQFGFTCAAVLAATGNDCQQNLHTLVASVPDGVTPATVCPASCGLCPPSTAGATQPPKPITQTFINGREVTPTGKNVLRNLGLPVPAGRFFLRADGSVGPENGPAVANVYTAVGSKIDQGVTEGYNQVQSSVVQTGEQIKAEFDQLGSQVKSHFDQVGGQIKTGTAALGDQLKREFENLG